MGAEGFYLDQQALPETNWLDAEKWKWSCISSEGESGSQVKVNVAL